MQPDTGIVTLRSSQSVDQTVGKIEELLRAKGVKLFALVDHSGEAKSAGLEMRPTKLLIFGNPKGGTPLMVAVPSVAIDLPLKILVAEDAAVTTLKKYVEELLALAVRYEDIETLCGDAEKIRQIQQYKKQIDLEFTKTDVIELLNESQEGASRVKKIVQDLKDFSHAGGDDDWQWANLHTCLESTLNILNNEIKYKASVIKAFGVIPDAWCLPHQLNQVFMNLLVNAAHAIENEGMITVRTGEENAHIWVEVSDNGKGIAPEHLDKIFDPFFTTKAVGQGTGLGLSVSYNIIKKHNGEIQIESHVGIGTTFRILLPKKSEAEGV